MKGIIVLLDLVIFALNAHGSVRLRGDASAFGPSNHGAPVHPTFSLETIQELKDSYMLHEKSCPYVGSPDYLAQFDVGSRHWFNSLAVAPYATSQKLHGLLGVYHENNTRLYHPKELPPAIISEADKLKEAEQGGGFNLKLANALPLDRFPPDHRASVCKTEKFDLKSLPDASIIITVYNEPMSTLLRSIHSVLNLTPPPLVREVIVIDDHSSLPEYGLNSYLEHYAVTVPKLRVVRLPERRGLVHARLLGAQLAKAPVIVVLDSHIEVSEKWLETLLQRIKESPTSLVFPQILSLNDWTMDYDKDRGIGCSLSFTWMMQESASAPRPPESTKAIPSASMAGGIFAVSRKLFWEMGGYDEHFTMWGAENVEMGFRYWMCGARVECAPCSLVYHIYRNHGTGYRSPSRAVQVNRLRTAKLWTGVYEEFITLLIGNIKGDVGPFDTMEEFKKKHQCRDFSWFLKHIDKVHDVPEWKNFTAAFELRNQQYTELCLDSYYRRLSSGKIGVHFCHGLRGSQSFILTRQNFGQLRPVTSPENCIDKTLELKKCDVVRGAGLRVYYTDNRFRFKEGDVVNCLTVVPDDAPDRPFKYKLALESCKDELKSQIWLGPNRDFLLPDLLDTS